MKKIVLSLILSSIAIASAYGSYSSKTKNFLYLLDLNSVPNHSKLAYQTYEILAEIEEIMPPAMKEAFSRPITIVFAKPEKSEKGLVGWVDRSFSLKGRQNNSILNINKDHFKSLDKEEMRELLKRTIIHESAHLFDYRNVRLGRELEFQKHCESLPQIIIKKEGDKLIYGPNRRECVKYLANEYSVSQSPVFLTLSGWNLEGTIFKGLKQINKNEVRSVDAYEYTNPRESFAVNMEFYLTDPEFQCRRPTLNKYYAELFDYRPFREDECQSYTQVTSSSGALSPSAPKVVDLDYNRLYQVHYLFASEGDAMMSKWGHAMFRLVMCRPGREVGPKCLDDIAHHVVISFRANVDDAQIDYIKGLNGDYDSQLFILTMKDVIDEYTKGEFRDLLSIPLNYNREHLKQFVQSTLEQYWSYLGSYYFISNNCATETMRLIRTTSFDDFYIQDKSVLSPLGLMELLEESGLAQMSVLKDKKMAIKKGYLFPRASENLAVIYSELKLALGFTQKDFKEFAEKSTVSDRHYRYQKISLKNKAQARKMLAKALQLEEFIKTYKEESLMKGAASKLADLEKIGPREIADLKDKLVNFNTLLKKLSVEQMVKPGYGIPLVDDINARNIDTEAVEEEMKAIQEDLASNIRQFFPEQIYELEKIQQTRFELMEELKKTL